MGHQSYDEVVGEMASSTRKHYASKVIDDVGSSPKIALMGLQNMYGEVLGLDNLNELAGEFNLDLPDLTKEGSPKLIVVPKNQDIASNVRIQGELTDEDLDLIEERKIARKAELGARTSKSELEKIQADIEKEKAKPELFAAREATLEQDIDLKLKKQELTKQKKEEKRLALEAEQKKVRDEEIAEDSKALKEKLGNTKMFGKFLKVLGPLGVGISATVASQRAEAEGKSPFEQAFYTASEVLPVSAYDIEDLGKFTAEAREVGIPKALGLDTQKQEQMNIQRKERLARRSERVSSANKSSLDDQINQLLSGR
jgi:hypothetical protein